MRGGTNEHRRVITLLSDMTGTSDTPIYGSVVPADTSFPGNSLPKRIPEQRQPPTFSGHGHDTPTGLPPAGVRRMVRAPTTSDRGFVLRGATSPRSSCRPPMADLRGAGVSEIIRPGGAVMVGVDARTAPSPPRPTALRRPGPCETGRRPDADTRLTSSAARPNCPPPPPNRRSGRATRRPARASWLTVLGRGSRRSAPGPSRGPGPTRSRSPVGRLRPARRSPAERAPESGNQDRQQHHGHP